MGEALRAIWYVTRKYPPSVGGMQRLAHQIARSLQARTDTVVVRWGRSQAGLPIFIMYAAARLVWGVARNKVGLLHLGDPALAALGLIARVRGVPVIATVHGLDVTYRGSIYRWYLNRFFWRHLDGYICISHFVADLLIARGISRDRIRVIPLGIDVPPGISPPGGLHARPTLLILGRLVPRKGVAWFTDNVAPELFRRHPDARLVVAGEGPDRDRIRASIASHRLDGNVEMRGAVDHVTKQTLLATCDAVVMPNIPVAGDVEGFGLVALEAGASGKLTFAADLEGLRDAVRNGENGWRLPAGDAAAWIDALDRALSDRRALSTAGQRALQCVRTDFNWTEVGRAYANNVGDFARR